MPTEHKRSITSPTSATNVKDNNVIIPRLQEQHQQYPSKQQLQELTQLSIEEREQQHRPHNNSNLNLTMEIDNMSTSQTSTTSSNGSCNGSKKTTIASADPTAYVAKARVTRPTPPPPPYNPMQFVQIKPCNLYQTAQEQLKKAEEVKKIQEIRKEEPEDWQNNLDNWKSSRRKRVEHIIDRVVEVKKLEMEEHDRTRRKSKTFSEMIEERGERAGRSLNKLASLAVYNEDESNDLSDLGIGTSSASGKSSLSEDYDNNSVISDNVVEFEKAIMASSQKSTKNSTTREYISSPGYETSSSTAPASSPDPCEYTYEGAIQDYKQRVSRAACGLMAPSLNKVTVNNTSNGIVHSKESTPERFANGSQNGNAGFKEIYPPRRGSKIEDRLIGFEVQSPSEECVEQKKVDVPKIDISKRKEIFENQQQLAQQYVPKSQGVLANTESGTSTAVQRVSIRDRFKVQDNHSELSEFNRKDNKCSSGEITSIKDRLQSLEQQKQHLVKSVNSLTKSSIVDIPVPPLKERLSSLQSAVAKEEVRKPPVALVDARQLEIMKNEDEKAKQALREVSRSEVNNEHVKAADDNEPERGVSRVHSADDIEIDDRGLQVEQLQKQQEHELHAAIEALALEEQQLAVAANVVNQIEAEFEELSLGSVALAPLPAAMSSSPIPVATASPSTNETMEYSVSSTNNDSFISYISNNDNSCSLKSSSLVVGNENKVKDFSSTTALNSTSKLPRKLTNEMIHARNLLKIFKDTFQNEEVELDETLKEELEREDFEISNRLGIVKTQKCEHSALAPELPPLTTKPPIAPTGSNSNVTAGEHHLSPTSQRKCSDSPFSINGRVEIFNSKSLHFSDNKMNLLSSTPPSPTPFATAKKSHLPYIVKASNNSSTTSNIEFPKQQKPTQSVTALQTVTEATTSVKQRQQEKIDTKPMPAMRPTVVNEPQSECHIRTSEAIKQQPEVVVCAPPVTIVNAEELPKPNTVKNLSSCFQQQCQPKQYNSTLKGKPISPPKPLPRSSQISQPPVAAKRNLMPLNKSEALNMEEEKKPPLISNSSTSSTCSSDCTVIEAQQNTYLRSSTTSSNSANTSAMEASKINSQVQIHGDESDEDKREESACLKSSKDVLSAEIPVLVVCSPNESSLYKLANSTPNSPSSPFIQTPTTPTSLVLDSALCSTLLTSLAITPALAKIQRQETVGEETCKILDVAAQRLPYAEYAKVNCEEIKNSSVATATLDTPRQPSTKEDFCQKVNIHTLPDSRQPSATTKLIPVSPTEICKSDNLFRSVGSLPLKSLSKPNSPIIAARAAHSRALIETCEKIIAEEKLASSQLKSTLPSCSLQCNTPISQRKSKIPLPLTTCCKPAESITEADLQQNTPPQNLHKDERDDNVVIARMHVVETQIKVTTTTPPTSPKPKMKSLSNSPQPQLQTQNSPRKTRNIFDFLKRNFGVGFQNTNEDTTSAIPLTPEPLKQTPNPLVLTNDDIVKYDEIHKIDNAKFYLPADDTPPPPLPDSPAPVNIEITKRFITDEIFEDGKTEMDLTMEINELLDDELNKLNEEIKELEKVEKTNN
uniref:DUF4757 domain-containing protein n=1 Tax=Glossina pallidipes TaxID=7398 RepID=A0A1A9Z8F5_GLOPL